MYDKKITCDNIRLGARQDTYKWLCMKEHIPPYKHNNDLLIYWEKENRPSRNAKARKFSWRFIPANFVSLNAEEELDKYCISMVILKK